MNVKLRNRFHLLHGPMLLFVDRLGFSVQNKNCDICALSSSDNASGCMMKL